MRPSEPGRDAARAGDASPALPPTERFERLFRENSRAILAYALRRTRRPEDAADVMSEVMLVAWRRIDDVPAGRDARLWLFGVARRVVANQGRSAVRRMRLGERLRQEVTRMAGPDLAEVHEERDTVRVALRRLPEGDREILLLVAWEELTPSEAAKVMATSALAARTRLHRARRRLRQELAAMGVNDDPGPQPRAQDIAEPGLYPRTEEES